MSVLYFPMFFFLQCQIFVSVPTRLSQIQMFQCECLLCQFSFCFQCQRHSYHSHCSSSITYSVAAVLRTEKAPHMTAFAFSHHQSQLFQLHLQGLQSLSFHMTVTGGRRSSSYRLPQIVFRLDPGDSYFLRFPC